MSAQDARALPPVDLFLQLVPQSPDETGAIPHAVALHAAPPEQADGVIFRIRIHPTAVDEGAHTRLAYTAEIAPLGLVSEPAPDHPWGHRTDTEAARQAALRVLAAPPDERSERILELLAEIAP